MKKLLICILVVAMMFAACTTQEKETDAKEMTEEKAESVFEERTAEKPTEETIEEVASHPKTVAIVVALDGYAPGELHPVIDAVISAGYDFAVISNETGEADGTTEASTVSQTFADFAPEDLLGIVVIGGSESLWDNEQLHALISGVHELDRVTAGICLNSVTLAKAGVIGEGNSACWFNCDSADAEMEALGVTDSGQPVTVNGNIITGNGPDAAEEFAAEVVKAIDALG